MRGLDDRRRQPTAAPQRVAQQTSRLHPLAPLALQRDACLALAAPWTGCGRCVAACPRDCLEVSEHGLRLSGADCSACGRCAAACPTEALSLTDDAPALTPGDTGVATLACRRVAGERAGPPRCPATIPLRRLLAWLTVDARTLVLVEPEHCERCVAGGPGESPVHRLAETLRWHLEQCGVSPQRVRRVASLPVDASMPREAQPPASGRRGFFMGLARAAGRAVERVESPAPGRPARGPARVPFAGGHALRAVLEALAGSSVERPPAARLPAVSVDARCRAHGTCAVLCPTGALAVRDLPGQRSLVFDAWQCVACGACARACPEGALTCAEPAGRPVPAGPVELAQRPRFTCPTCGAAGHDVHPVDGCAACAKSTALARAGFVLRRMHAERPMDTGPP